MIKTVYVCDLCKAEEAIKEGPEPERILFIRPGTYAIYSSALHKGVPVNDKLYIDIRFHNPSKSASLCVCNSCAAGQLSLIERNLEGEPNDPPDCH
jgi:hypothetical protein